MRDDVCKNGKTKGKKQQETHKDKGDDTMASIAKPCNSAFTLKSDKVEQFLQRKNCSEKTMDRFFAHKPKEGVVTPFKKGKDV